jgi:D-tyrosyl-tRNA(Tyr) deacylase
LAAARAVVQRAINARVVGEIAHPGLVVFVGATHADTEAQARALTVKVHTLRILDGELSCADTGAPLLAISRLTLDADTRKGRHGS